MFTLARYRRVKGAISKHECRSEFGLSFLVDKVSHHKRGEGAHPVLEESLAPVGKDAIFVYQISLPLNVSLRLPEHRHIKKREDAAQMLLRDGCASAAGGNADDPCGATQPRVVAIGA